MVNKSKKSKKFVILYFLIIFIIVVASVEVGVRLLKIAPHSKKQLGGFGGNVRDPHLPYKPKPFKKDSGRSQTDEFDYNCESNSFGFRDVEHSYEKPEGVFRILGLGDSFTQGACANFEDTYLYRLENMLNSREGEQPKIEIIKAGIGGYGPDSERILLEHYGVKYEPDLILVGFMPNDVFDAYVGMEHRMVTEDGYLTTREAHQLGKVGLWLYVNSHACRIVLAKYVEHLIKNKLDMSWDKVWYINEYSDKAWERIDVEFRKMLDIARKINAKIVFVYIPQQPNPVKGWGDGWIYPKYRLYQWCQKNRAYLIDTLPSMQQAFLRGEELYYKKDGHCTPAGYRVVAETLFQGLTELKLVPCVK